MAQRENSNATRLVQSPQTDPDNPAVSALQKGRISGREAPAFALLFAESVLLPENRPPDLPKGSLEIYSSDYVQRFTWASYFLRASEEGWMVKGILGSVNGLMSHFARPFVKRERRELYASEESSAEDSEFA